MNEIDDFITKESNAKKLSLAAQLQAIRDKANAGYNQSINGLQGTYQPLRDSQDFQATKNIKATNEQMASMGIANSGDLISAQIQNRVGNENSINDLNKQQQGEKTNFQDLISSANNSYNTGVASGNANIDADATQQRLQAMQLAEAQRISKENADREYNYRIARDKVADQRYTSELSYKNANSGGTGGGESKPASQANTIKAMRAQFDAAVEVGRGTSWLEANKNSIYSTIPNGEDEYRKMLKIVNTTANHVKEVKKTHALNYNMSPNY